MNRKTLDKRLRELGIYSEYYMRKELRALIQLVDDTATLNCILTGVHDANRKMLAITDSELIIIFAGALGTGDVKVISRNAVQDFSFEKKFLRSKVTINSLDGVYVFTATQAARKELFEWAMNQPIKTKKR